MMSLHSRLTAQHLPNYSNANDVTIDLPSLNFEHGLNEYEERYQKLRARHHSMTVLSVANATYMASTLNRVRQLIAEKKHEQVKMIELFNKTRSRDPIKVGIIGCGRLGKQIVSSLLYFADVRPNELIISTRQPEKINNLQQAGIKCVHDNRMVAQNCDLIFLCFSPSSLVAVAEEIVGHIKHNALVFSFLVAVCLDRLKAMLKIDRISRMDLSWSPKSVDASWQIGNDVISCLLDPSIIPLCCPTSNKDDKQVIETPTKAIEMIVYHMTNMLVDMDIPPQEIIVLLNQVLIGEHADYSLAWEELLTTDELKKMMETNGQLPRFSITEISANDNTPMLMLLQTNKDFRLHFTRKFLSIFSRLYHKPTDK